MNDIKKAISAAIDWMDGWGIPVPPDVVNKSIALGIKSFDYYSNTIYHLVRNLYNGNTDELEFVQIMESLLDGQMPRAWLEGMAQNGLTEDDMTEDWQAALDEIIASEKSFLLGFADAIVADGANRDAMLSRADIWANRYNDVVNKAAMMTAGTGARMVWKLGATEKHCPFCKDLDGIVAFASEWDALDIRPQNPPNHALTGEKDGDRGCEGWRCDCSLLPTDKRRSRDAYGRLEEILLSR